MAAAEQRAARIVASLVEYQDLTAGAQSLFLERQRVFVLVNSKPIPVWQFLRHFNDGLPGEAAPIESIVIAAGVASGGAIATGAFVALGAALALEQTPACFVSTPSAIVLASLLPILVSCALGAVAYSIANHFYSRPARKAASVLRRLQQEAQLWKSTDTIDFRRVVENNHSFFT